MQEYEIEDITVDGMEPGGGVIRLRLDSSKGPIVIRVSIEKAKRFASIIQSATPPPARLAFTQDDVKDLGVVESVTKARVGRPFGSGPDKDKVFVSFETDSGSRGFLLEISASDELISGLTSLAQRGLTRH